MIRFNLGDWTVGIWPSEIIGLTILACGIWVFWTAQRDKRNPINLAGMFVWPGTKHTSMAMFLAFWAALIAMWVIIDQELKGRLSEGIFLSFLATLVAGKAATEGINAWRSRTRPPEMGDEHPH